MAHYEEPIARNVKQAWMSMNRWWAELNVTPPVRFVLLGLIIMMAVLNSGWLISMLLTALIFYVPYYAIWWLVKGPTPPSARPQAVALNANAQHFRPTPPQAPFPQAQFVAQPRTHQPAQPPVQRPVAVNRPMTIKQWRVAKRRQLAQVKRGQVWSEVTGSWLGSAAVIGVFSLLAVVFQVEQADKYNR